ncbi:MAG: sigma-54-dependent Fis family transcriptional regulator [Desulfobacterales bacterium]|nr:sigma-54-dependent Fis family transcriptional regulator [Desulfobacterales bacterium]
MPHILVVDDEEKMRHLLSIILSRHGYKVDEAGDGQEALKMVRSTPFDMVITDMKMAPMDGMELLRKITRMKAPCPVVFITAFATVDSAVEAMRQGALDYITKPFEEDRILLAVERTLSLSRIISENRDLRQELQKVKGSEEIVYESKEMSEIMALASKVAESESAVMITGESGTGKELLAAYIHNASPRREGRFVPVNCAAISPNLVESELFGHEKGSFTGADRRSIGKFEYASNGTIFMDEIGDLPLEAQAKLLRTLQEKKIQRVGGNEEIPVDVRVICATNQDLNKLVGNGAFRQDLYFRINVFPVQPLPLRERSDDIAPLVRHFLHRKSRDTEIKLSEGAVRVFKEYTWPGNVRELANAVERAVILAKDQGAITADTVSFLRTSHESGSGFKLPPEGVSLEKVETSLVRQAFEMSGKNQTTAAKLMGLTRAKFRVLMKRAEKEGVEK